MKIVNGVDVMENIISYKGINTNNLKGLDLNIKKGSFIGIAGPSGSGKSSLAYGTIYAIAKNEWNKVAGDELGFLSSYKIKSYKNVIPAIALRQDNYNSNPRSTIATFLHLDRAFRLIYSSVNNISPSIFSFNNPQSACPYCGGLGHESVIDEHLLIDWDKSIKEKPFLLWKKPYEQKLLEKYAESKAIPLNLPLAELNKEQIELLLHDKSSEKYSVYYKINGKARTHQFRYIGYLEDVEVLSRDKKHISSYQKIVNASVIKVCGHCHGSRFNDKVLSYKYRGKNLGELYLMEIDDLVQFIDDSSKKEKNKTLVPILENINGILNGIKDGKLEYLNLNRSIPSLSGGELQRLRLLNILNSQIEDIMYIIDEPSARLHVSEYDSLIHDILKLKQRGNTILMIEHNPYFLSKTDYNIFVGPGAGENGGRLLKNIPKSPNLFSHEQGKIAEKFLHLDNISENNINNLSVDIAVNCITGIYGPSGSGKSTLAKNIAKKCKHTEYITQKPLRGSSISTIASYSGIMDDIRQVFARENNVDVDYFNFNKEKGQCPTCKGKGILTYDIDFGKTKVNVLCEDCHGSRYNSLALSYKYKNKSIVDVLSMTIDSLIAKKIFEGQSSIIKQLEILQKLGLGYLSLFRTTDTLSGGEAQRLKLIKFIGKKIKDKLFIFDEPLRGLSQNDALNLLHLFREMTNQGSTVIFIEHNILGLKVCDYVLEMGPGKGKHGGEITYFGSSAYFNQSIFSKKYRDKEI